MPSYSSAALTALWLTAATAPITPVDAFTTPPQIIQSSIQSKNHAQSLSMLSENKFDAIVTTKLSKRNSKKLGYDDRTGRFFEIKSSNGESSSTLLENETESEVMMNGVSGHGDQADSTSASTAVATAEKSILDIPPIPDSDSFSGMNVTGEINGVKMTSSGQKNTLKRKLINDADEKLEADMDILQPSNDEKTNISFSDRLASSSAISAAAMATAAVNAAVSMKSLTAPSVDKSYISLDTTSKSLDPNGLPLVYDKDLIERYWKKERGALNERWSYFVGKAVPFLTKLVTLYISEGEIDERHIPGLSRRARLDLQDLGPTFIKLGQMMSVRPDVLPPSTLEELTKLQDAVIPFETSIAVQCIEDELGGPLGQFFTSISEEPVAAASLAQVYLATLNDGHDTKVAIKVQRPNVLSTVSKDLYVLRRAAEVFQGLIDRFAPIQKTNYVALLNEWAIGFYTELDFANEGKNQQRLRDNMIEAKVGGITVPKVYEELCTRRVLVSEWMDGVKLSECSKEEIKEITAVAQEAFLTQLFENGFFHADPHPGNILKLNNPTPEGHTVALIDCGLMASIDRTDQDHMISAVIHLCNKDYASLVDDFIKLTILPEDCDRPAIIPLMDKALSPYVKGGGAKKYVEELNLMYGMEEGSMSSQVGGFQAMTQDALTVMNDIPFSIPPYFAILGRAIVTLEGIALTGDEGYGIIMESYPFIARKLLAENRPEIQQALQEVLFSVTDSGGEGGLKLNRLLALLNNASGSVGTKEGASFVDLDAIPEDGLSLGDGMKLLLSEKAGSLRRLLEGEVETIADLLFRQIMRKGVTEALVTFTPPRPPTLPFLGDILSPPKVQLDDIPLPFLLATGGSGDNGNDPNITPFLSLMTIKEFTDLIAPKLTRDEEIYAISIADAAEQFAGREVANFLRGDGIIGTQSAQVVLAAATSGLMGNTNILGAPAVRNVLNGLMGIVQRLDTISVSRGSGGVGGGKSVEMTFAEATSKLSTEEKESLDEIVTELTKRMLQRLTTRMGAKR